jgi:hypothetical protein
VRPSGPRNRRGRGAAASRGEERSQTGAELRLALAALLGAAADLLRRLDDPSWSLLLTGGGRLTVEAPTPGPPPGETGCAPPGTSAGRAPRRRGAAPADPEAWAQRLAACATRGEAERLLETATRAELLALARHVGAAARSRDPKRLVADGIVEAVLGARLRAAAIRGVPLPRWPLGAEPPGGGG